MRQTDRHTKTRRNTERGEGLRTDRETDKKTKQIQTHREIQKHRCVGGGGGREYSPSSLQCVDSYSGLIRVGYYVCHVLCILKTLLLTRDC